MSSSKEISGTVQEKFWKKYHGEYKGQETSSIVTRMAVPFIGRSIIDLGAGSGDLIKLLKAKFTSKIIGIDLAPKSRLIQKGDITKLAFPAKFFDTMFCTDVLEHLSTKDLPSALKEMSRVCATGGHVIVSTVNDEKLKLNTVLCPHCNNVFHRWGHQQSFTVQRLVKLFENYGFTPVNVKKTHLAYRANHPIRSFFAYFLGIDKLVEKFLHSKRYQKDIFIVFRKLQ